MTKKLLSNIFWFFIVPFYNLIYYFINKSNVILITGWSLNIGNKVYKRNFGDDIAYDIVRYLSNDPKKKVLNIRCILFGKHLKQSNYAIIGSIINSDFCNSKTIIYNAGIIEEPLNLKYTPREILSVRGPLSRNCLVENNINCPDIFFDSSFLLKQMYQPKVEKKYKIGLIPHTFEEEFIPLKDLCDKFDSIVVISVRKYNNWRDVIDKICECEIILSSSLHGIIVSDVYNVPNKFVKLYYKEIRKQFKFVDYCLSVNRLDKEQLDLTNLNDISLDVRNYILKYQHIKVDTNKLLDINPFKKY